MARTTIPEQQLSTNVQDKLNDKYTKLESDSKFVDVTGDTISGELIMTAPITQTQSLITKEYADVNYMSSTEPKRMTNLYELGYDNSAFSSMANMEDMLYDIGSRVVEVYSGENNPTIQIDQYSDATTIPMIYNLFKIAIDTNPYWHDMTWSSTMMRIEIQNPSLTSGGLFNVTMFRATDMRIFLNITFRMSDQNVISNWVNQNGKTGEGEVLLWQGNTQNAPIPFTHNVKNFDFLKVGTDFWSVMVPVYKVEPILAGDIFGFKDGEYMVNFISMICESTNAITFADMSAYSGVYRSSTASQWSPNVLSIYGVFYDV